MVPRLELYVFDFFLPLDFVSRSFLQCQRGALNSRVQYMEEGRGNESEESQGIEKVVSKCVENYEDKEEQYSRDVCLFWSRRCVYDHGECPGGGGFY